MPLITLMLNILLAQTSFYSLQIQNSQGETVSFNQFEGKKVLIVNFSTNSSTISQLAELTQLQQQFGDSLVVIAFPTGSFLTEAKSDEEIAAFCEQEYHTNFIIAKKGMVTGEYRQSVYEWLANPSLNGQFATEATEDSQKYLVNGDGRITALFSASVTPMNAQVINAIRASNE